MKWSLMDDKDRKDKSNAAPLENERELAMNTESGPTDDEEIKNVTSDLIERIEDLESDMEQAKEYSHLAADALEMLHSRLEKLEKLVVNFLKLQGFDLKAEDDPKEEITEKIEGENESELVANVVYL